VPFSDTIHVVYSETASSITSTYSGIRESYVTGESVVIEVISRDEFGNVRLTGDDTFQLYITGQEDNLELTQVFTNNHNGTYHAEQMLTKTMAYTVNVQLWDGAVFTQIYGSPVQNVDCFDSLV
jgi:hypothetical protein